MRVDKNRVEFLDEAKESQKWIVIRGRGFAKIHDGFGTTIAERVPLEIADRLANLPILEAENERLRKLEHIASRVKGAYEGIPHVGYASFRRLMWHLSEGLEGRFHV